MDAGGTGSEYIWLATVWRRTPSVTGSKSGRVGAPGWRSGAVDTPGVVARIDGVPGVSPGFGRCPWWGRISPGGSASPRSGPPRSGVLMVVVDLHVLEHAERVVRQHRDRAVEREEVVGRPALVDAHQPNRQAGAHLAGKARLEEANDA